MLRSACHHINDTNKGPKFRATYDHYISHQAIGQILSKHYFYSISSKILKYVQHFISGHKLFFLTTKNKLC